MIRFDVQNGVIVASFFVQHYGTIRSLALPRHPCRHTRPFHSSRAHLAMLFHRRVVDFHSCDIIFGQWNLWRVPKDYLTITISALITSLFTQIYLNLVEVFVEHWLKFGGWLRVFWLGHQTVIISLSVYFHLRGILFWSVEVIADLSKVVLEVGKIIFGNFGANLTLGLARRGWDIISLSRVSALNAKIIRYYTWAAIIHPVRHLLFIFLLTVLGKILNDLLWKVYFLRDDSWLV